MLKTRRGRALLEAMKAYVRIVDALNRRVGRFAMYLLFAMMGILLWSSISKTFFNPSLAVLSPAKWRYSWQGQHN